jgi:hypothetical protein
MAEANQSIPPDLHVDQIRFDTEGCWHFGHAFRLDSECAD